ncbi:2-(1,2-epoxy-1,2-dihydrophenyl)acetyl-CoA isomerase PaaG [Roseomonas marmotae]|uniref:2-(1,2-epoxy-1,2-dihydrophenyl)acetyl-CoA isomerase n=1 Tax=Roseomonas marmotae TaxID=2768161 RepID=A0ABS3K9I2_9PROT|nr:2-(1,2-epoxy-1,2-dihydrophenyl)acetyl-CoA isomerase PaaG [Roseomonas marmotae]MBO1074107.1 2-(1,2-epoxy-1,2-dihydrophenyl)acetyl-CoA isomerase [Roseomonas marmotae]QTI78889.1 2-(1,2-epoxy-1,2-dihydrophenyl)acetyl-CoA isomerase [Roseomonas marmotae]
MDQVLRVEKRDGWWKLVLNRPDKLNAFNEALHTALYAALGEAADAEVCRAVLLTGEGRGFCAGQDLGDRRPGQGGPPDLGQTLERFYNPLISRIRSLPKPVVCAVNGVAAGAGANIAIACDIVLAAQSARFIQSFSKIALVPDSGGTFLLPRLIGEARAKALMFTAEPLPAPIAAEWGMIWKAVADDQLQTEAEALTQRLAAQSTEGLGRIKQALEASATNSLDQQLDLERDLQRQAGRSPDYAEGVLAFLEKRPPSFGKRTD